MKRLMIGLSALFMLGGGAMAQKVTVADVEAVPGETVSFSLSLSEGRADSYTTLKFDAQFPTEGFTTTGAYTVSEAWPGTLVSVGDVDAMGIAPVVCGSDSKIAGSAVDALLTVSFKVDENVAPDSYEVTLKNIFFEYPDENDVMVALKDYAPDVTFTVKVLGTHLIVLDEASTSVPETATGVNVNVKRTIKADEWSTICLPFAMTAEQVLAAFGSGVQLAEFKGTVSEFDNAENVVGIKVNFSEVSAIEANTPYIIKVSEAISEFSVDGVDITPEEDEAYVEFDNGKTGSRRVVYSGFYGTYHAGTVLDEHTLFLNDNKFWYSAGLTKMKAFRAYFDFQDVLSELESASARILIAFEDETTGISEMMTKRHGENERYYNLKGQQVDSPTKGLYIKDGKKMVVK